MSNIQWTDVTSNPIHLIKPDGSHGGHWCRKISPGCANCYAETQNQSGFFKFASHIEYIGEVPPNLIFDEAIARQWLSWRKPKKIFVCSMTDLFGEWVSDEWIDKIFAYMSVAHRHTFQLLTKRPERAIAYFKRPNLAQRIKEAGGLVCRPELPLKNVWFGTTTENQVMADKRIPILLEIPAAVRWLSVEPLLENVQLTFVNYVDDWSDPTDKGCHKINWIVVGGESGRARGCKLEWVESVVKQCQSADVPVFVKQLGSNAWLNDDPYKTSDRKGGKIEEFFAYLQVREFPAL